MKTVNCLLTGVGGQGAVLLSRLIGSAAMHKGYDIRGTETIGMAQRGGSVTSHVRMGKNIRSPLIGHNMADIIIGLEPAEAVRSAPFLAPDGILIVCDKPVMPVAASLGAAQYNVEHMFDWLRSVVSRLVIVSGNTLIEQCGEPKALNVALLGVAVATGALPFNRDDLATVIEQRLPERLRAVNIRALDTGLANF